ncbi:MAG TPA: alanine racemase [Candidatus Dormibacteraeota bacterium]|jgi:D-serine deaminase-like pyridoxal phosphate-dependent protein|nr:alanine racemase [Candidatus Dormibacteraeota bacterium]
MSSLGERTGWDYGRVIGRAPEDLPTPALLLDLDQVRSNIADMARRVAALNIGLRPHAKLHKNPTIARMQVDAGAVGLTVATVWEAAMMVHAQIPNVLIANEVVGPEKIRALAETAGEGEVTAAVDEAGNARDLSAAAREAGSTIGILVEVDVGMARGGVRSPAAALELARVVADLPGLRLHGVMGYEGHCNGEQDRGERQRKVGVANGALLEAADLLTGAGIECPVVSAGATNTYDITGANPRITELQAGSYVFMDAYHGLLAPEFPVALTVLGTVVSRHGTSVVLDSGRKTVGGEPGVPRVDLEGWRTRGLSEEHLLLDAPASSPVKVGDRLRVVPGYAPTTVNLHDVYYVVEEGVVADVWPILARGPGLGPLRP